MPSQKVYVIEDPERAAGKSPRRELAGRHVSPAPSSAARVRPPASSKSWPLALRAYLLGPLDLVLWPHGAGRVGWAIIGATSLVTTTLLWLRWGPFLDLLDRSGHGIVIGGATVAIVTLLVAAAWARAVATSMHPVRWPRLLRKPGTVGALGFVFPGLGLLIMGRRWKAAFAILCAALLVASLVIANQWRRLAAPGGDGLEHLNRQAGDAVLIAVAGCLLLGALAWLVQALDGIRAAAPAARSGALANGLAVVLLVSLAAFFASVRPVIIARELELRAVRLQNQGLRIAPLALYEAAAFLDRGEPAYLARAATLCDGLGASGKADAKRDLLRSRAEQFAGAVGAELVSDAARGLEPPVFWQDPERLEYAAPSDRYRPVRSADKRQSQP